MTDFRSQRMPTPEGHGNAAGRWRQAWDTYSRTVNRVVEPFAAPHATNIASRLVEDQVGFWLMWHLEGGFEGLQRMGMSRSAIYRRVNAFRKRWGVHPDDFAMPGVTIDVDAYVRARQSPAVEPADGATGT
jgi:hypothetical protein